MKNTEISDAQVSNLQDGNMENINAQGSNTQVSVTQVSVTQVSNTQVSNTQVSNTQVSNTQVGSQASLVRASLVRSSGGQATQMGLDEDNLTEGGEFADAEIEPVQRQSSMEAGFLTEEPILTKTEFNANEDEAADGANIGDVQNENVGDIQNENVGDIQNENVGDVQNENVDVQNDFMSTAAAGDSPLDAAVAAAEAVAEAVVSTLAAGSAAGSAVASATPSDAASARSSVAPSTTFSAAGVPSASLPITPSPLPPVQPSDFICNECNVKIERNESRTIYRQKVFHVSCFVCVECKTENLAGINGFYVHGDKRYCVNCFNKNVAERCTHCGEAIFEGGVRHRTRPFHYKCFKCMGCEVVLGKTPFVFRDGRMLCLPCFADKFAERCAACSDPIVPGTQFLMVEGQRYHEMCLKCDDCHTELQDLPFVQEGSQNLCVSCSTGGTVKSDAGTIGTVPNAAPSVSSDAAPSVSSGAAPSVSSGAAQSIYPGAAQSISSGAAQSVSLDVGSATESQNPKESIRGSVEGTITVTDWIGSNPRSESVKVGAVNSNHQSIQSGQLGLSEQSDVEEFVPPQEMEPEVPKKEPENSNRESVQSEKLDQLDMEDGAPTQEMESENPKESIHENVTDQDWVGSNANIEKEEADNSNRQSKQSRQAGGSAQSGQPGQANESENPKESIHENIADQDWVGNNANKAEEEAKEKPKEEADNNSSRQSNQSVGLMQSGQPGQANESENPKESIHENVTDQDSVGSNENNAKEEADINSKRQSK